MPRHYNNPDETACCTKKTCNKCKCEKTLIDFPFKNKSLLLYRPECRECRKIVLKVDNLRRKLKKKCLES